MDDKSLKKCAIHAYKYDGNLYRIVKFPWVLYQDSEVLFLYLPIQASETFVQKYKEKKITNFGHLDKFWFFFKDKWFNVIINLKNSTNFSYSYYINLASPFIYQDDVISYIDFDLDIRVKMNNSYHVVDVPEYKENALKFNYSSEIKQKINQTKKEVFQLIKSKWFNELFNAKQVHYLAKVVANLQEAQKMDKNNVVFVLTKKMRKSHKLKKHLLKK